MQTDGDTTPDLPLTDADIAAYKAVAARQAHGDIERLTRLGLVVENPYEPGRFVALDPRDAQQKLLEARYADLTTVVEQLRSLPQLESLRAAYDPERMYGHASSELLPTMAQMDTRLGEASSRATDEVLSAQPTPRPQRDQQSLQTGSDRSLTLLRRGVKVRLLYGPAATADAESRAYVENFIAAGGEARIHRKPFVRTVIVDGRDAFIDDFVAGHPSTAAGWHISDRAAVAWARRVFTHLWDSSCTWEESLSWGESLPTERQLQILGDLDAGYDQPTIARRVRISPRQLTADIKEARETLGLSSTYQLMSWYGRWMARLETPGPTV
jgi:sugar-specific transcriptional regulator TrmB